MSADGNGQNSNKDRIAALKEKIEPLKAEIETLEARLEQLGHSELDEIAWLRKNYHLHTLKDTAQALKDTEQETLTALENELREGRYFAKADDIFPRDKYELIDSERSEFEGAADKMTRENPPKGNDGLGLYESELQAFLKHLDEDGSVADMNSVVPSSSDASSISEHASGLPQGGKAREMPPPNLKRSIIPDKEGYTGHLLPNAETCAPWWSLVCLWALGTVSRLDDLYEEIMKEENADDRQALEKRLGDALVRLATGTMGGSPGMRSSSRNILYVPYHRDKYYDGGYNWITIPIMTLEEIKDWDGSSYEIAIFVGEHGKAVESSENEEYGPSKHSAVDAEAALFGSMASENIKICTKEDLIKVTDVLTHFLKAFADLHTRSRRSRSDDGIPRKDVSPGNWGIIDLSDAVQRVMGSNEDTKHRTFLKSKKGIEDLIAQLSMKGSGGEEMGGILIPKCDDTNCFGGKHVFKAEVEQAYPPDPMFVGAKGTVNFGRQSGTSLLPVLSDESSLDSSYDEWIEDKDFTGCEIAVVIPESLHRNEQVSTVGDNDLNADSFSDVSCGDFLAVDEEKVPLEE